MLGLSTSGLSLSEKPCFDLGNRVHLVWNSLTQNRYGNALLTVTDSAFRACTCCTRKNKNLQNLQLLRADDCPLGIAAPRELPVPADPPAGSLEVIIRVDGKVGKKAQFGGSGRGRDASSVLIQPAYSCSCSLLQETLIPRQLLSSPRRVCPCLQLSRRGSNDRRDSKHGYSCLL